MPNVPLSMSLWLFPSALLAVLFMSVLWLYSNSGHCICLLYLFSQSISVYMVPSICPSKSLLCLSLIPSRSRLILLVYIQGVNIPISGFTSAQTGHKNIDNHTSPGDPKRCDNKIFTLLIHFYDICVLY